MIICEVGLNHMGDIKYANEYIDRIIDAKSDGAIFHLREKSFYLGNIGSKLILPDEFYFQAAKKLKKNGLKFGIALADPDRIDFCEKVDVDFYKIFSRDINDTILLNKIIKTKKKTFVSTGLSDIREIRRFVRLVKSHKKRFTLVHTQLDNDLDLVNLKAIPMLKEKFGMPVAYGNHAGNPNVLYVALAYEPTDLLFYVKGTKVERHVDEPHAVALGELDRIINDLRELPRSIGERIKIKMNPRIK
ncbi:MAG: N-acetylneuraminate synthase family protein [Nitrosopumilaceae archaeon]